MSKLMSVNEASIKDLKAYAHDDNPKVIVVYVIDLSGNPVFSALRNHKKVWSHADVTFEDLSDDYHLILDFNEVKALVTEAKKSLSD